MASFFNDWKRFCFVLREIASGENGIPLPGLEAQKRAQAVLSECGYTWSWGDRRPNRTIVLYPSSEKNPEVEKTPRMSRRSTR
jgi:hypothetical protein